MKTCSNCYYFDKCSDTDKKDGRCCYYDAVYGHENVVLKEYLKDLKEREKEYQKIMKEFDS